MYEIILWLKLSVTLYKFLLQKYFEIWENFFQNPFAYETSIIKAN